MATKVWKGFLNFGLLSIPVYLNVAARDKKVELHTFHVACNGPVRSPKYCPACEVMLQPTEIYRGFEHGDNIIPLSDEEMESITPPTEKVMEITDCVLWKDVDPIFLAESFFLLPDPAGIKAYSLLVKTLIDTGRCAVAQLSKSSREHIAIIRPKGNGLMLHYAWYCDEIAQVAEFDDLQLASVSASEIKLAKQLIESLASDFQPEQYQDGYRGRFNQLISSKMDKSIEAPKAIAVVQPKAMDITAALTASLQAPPKKKKPVVAQSEPVAKKKAKKVA